jgi:hypothetical protein
VLLDGTAPPEDRVSVEVVRDFDGLPQIVRDEREPELEPEPDELDQRRLSRQASPLCGFDGAAITGGDTPPGGGWHSRGVSA